MHQKRYSRATMVKADDLDARRVMAPIFEAMGGPRVAASFGNQPGTVKLYDTSTPEGIDALYTEADRAAKMRRSSFLNLGNWERVGKNDRGNVTLSEATAIPADDWYVCWADIDAGKGKINWGLLKALTRRGAAVFRSPSGGKNVHVWWFFDEPMTMFEVKARNRRIKHALGADDKDNPVNFLRVPYAPSFKDKHAGRSLTVKSFDDEPWSADEFDALLALEGFKAPERVDVTNDARERVTDVKKPTRRVVTGPLRRGIQYAVTDNADDRSAGAYAVIKEVVRAGLTINDAAGILWCHALCEDVRGRYDDEKAVIREVERVWPKAVAAVKAETGEADDADQEELIVESAAGSFKRTRWLIPNWVPIGELSLMAGFEGLNKSTLCIDWSARVSRGELDGEWKDRPRGVLYIATEDSWSATIMPRLEIAGADRTRVFRLRPPGSKRSYVDMTRYLKQVAGAVVQHNVGLIVFDPISSALTSARNIDSEEGLRNALDPIIDMAEETQVAIIGLKHFTKLESADPAKLMGGNRAWSMIARSTIMLARDPEDPARVVVGVHKNNLAAPTPARHFRPEIVEVEAEGEMVGHPRIKWEGDSEYTPHTALAANLSKERAATSPQRGEKRASAQEWLIGYLKEHGPTHRATVLQDANEAGYSTRTVDRAWAEMRADRLATSDKDERGYPLWALKGR